MGAIDEAPGYMAKNEGRMFYRRIIMWFLKYPVGIILKSMCFTLWYFFKSIDLEIFACQIMSRDCHLKMKRNQNNPGSKGMLLNFKAQFWNIKRVYKTQLWLFLEFREQNFWCNSSNNYNSLSSSYSHTVSHLKNSPKRVLEDLPIFARDARSIQRVTS